MTPREAFAQMPDTIEVCGVVMHKRLNETEAGAFAYYDALNVWPDADLPNFCMGVWADRNNGEGPEALPARLEIARRTTQDYFERNPPSKRQE